MTTLEIIVKELTRQWEGVKGFGLGYLNVSENGKQAYIDGEVNLTIRVVRYRKIHLQELAAAIDLELTNR